MGSGPAGLACAQQLARAGHAPHMAMRIDKKLIDMLPKGTLSMVMKLPALKGVRDSAGLDAILQQLFQSDLAALDDDQRGGINIAARLEQLNLPPDAFDQATIDAILADD